MIPIPTSLLISAVLLAPVPTAAAGTGLAQARPGPDEVLREAPEAVVLRPEAPVDALTARVLDGAGEPVTPDEGSLLGGVYRLPLPELPPGTYLVDWRLRAGTAVEAGAYRFVVDPTGAEALPVSRTVRSGVASSVAAAALVLALALLVGAATERAGPEPWTGRAALAVVVAALVGALVVGTPAGPSEWLDALRSVAAGPWLAVAAAMAGVPYLTLGAREGSAAVRRPTWWAVAGAVLGVGVVAGSLAAAPPLGLPAAAVGLGVCGMAAAVASRRRRVVAGATLLLVGAVVVAAAVGSRSSAGVVERVARDGVVFEVAVTPGEVGTNELHLYAFEPGGAIVPVADAVAFLRELERGTGPMRVELLRAGPHHFLTYGAHLPFAGTWEVRFAVVTDSGDRVDLRAAVEAG